MDLYNEIRADLESKEKVGFSSLDEAIDYYKCNLKVYELSEQRKQAEKERQLIAWLEDYKNLTVNKNTPTGEWIEETELEDLVDWFKCNLCGEVECFKSNFCPHCGARMFPEGKQDD